MTHPQIKPLRVGTLSWAEIFQKDMAEDGHHVLWWGFHVMNDSNSQPGIMEEKKLGADNVWDRDRNSRVETQAMRVLFDRCAAQSERSRPRAVPGQDSGRVVKLVKWTARDLASTFTWHRVGRTGRPSDFRPPDACRPMSPCHPLLCPALLVQLPQRAPPPSRLQDCADRAQP